MKFLDFLSTTQSLQEANKGTEFERKTYETLEKWLAGVVDTDAEVDRMISALHRLDSHITINTIAEIHWAGGSPTRPANLEDSGGIIADLIFVMKNGKRHFVSIKERTGSTFANFGIGSNLINPRTFAVNTNSPVGQLMVEAGVDVAKVQQGYKDRAEGVQSEFQTEDRLSVPVVPGTELYNKIKEGWGQNYFYLREDPSQELGWFAMIVNGAAHKRLMTGLNIYKIRYPHNRGAGSKQVSIFFRNSVFNYELEIRNTSGGELPNKMQLKTISPART